uniref:Reverse transcriptase domain-containing protein n=1 Tax=Tanacetum cinerariifolium TaxID=118510 RepID=A0A6L2J3R6_TANCI|nr:hypothetical protein [Tanacetum cinerariifolium]
MREDSQNSSAKTLSARYRSPSERPQIRDRLRNNDGNVFGRLGHRRQSAFKRLSDTYSPSTTNSRPDREYSRDGSYSRGRPHKRDSSPSRDRPRSRDRSYGIEESYGTARIWFDELFPESIDGYKDLKAAFLAYFMQQRKYVKDPVEIHNIKQKDGETIEDFIERFKVETGRMKGAPECMRISGFMHGKLMSLPKRKCTLLGRRQNSKRKSDFRNQPMDGRGSNKFTPLTRTPKEIFAAESGKFKPPPPMVTPVVKRSSYKFCEFHNDKGHSTDECVQLRKQIEELKVTQSFAHIKEIMFPSLAANKGTGCPLVIEAEISRRIVHRIYVDGGSSMEVLYEHCFNRIQPEIKSQMVPATTSLTGFSGETIWPLGQLRLLVTIGDAEHYTRAWMNFMIVRSPSPDNGIIGRPGIKEIQAVPSTAHGMLKFPVNGGIVTIRSTILTPTECTTIAATPKDHAKKAEALHENFKTEKRGQAPERAKAIQVEVQKLVEAGILREVYYHDWLSNPDMVKKHDDSWRMCVDFTYLNKSCPLDCYPLPKMNWKVESLCGYPFKCFLDAYKGYHQIQMAEQDEENTAFHTSHGVYCYTKMPFGLKNASTTYQRLVDKAFDRQIDAKQSFKQLKQHLARLPMLVAPKPKEELIMYLYASYGAISAVLMTERDTIQTPVYFVSRALQAPELNYTPMEKLVLTLVCAAKRLRGYFQAHPIVIITDQPIKQVMSRPDVARRLQKWSVMLVEHNITYRPRTSMKGQILADFLVKNSDDAPPKASMIETPQEPWILFTNRSSCVDGSEYEALIAGLRIAAQMGVRNVHVLVKVLKEKSIQEEEVATVVEEEGPTWMTPIMEHLKDGTLTGDRNKASKLRIKARQYELWEGVLYRRSFLKSWLRKGQVFDSRYGLFHKVDRGESRGNNHRQSGEEVRVGQHSMPLRSPRRNSLEQRHADTPFSLTNGTKAVIPVEIGMPTYRTAVVDAVYNNEELRLNLDLLEERRECTAIREATEKSKMTKYYNTKVCGITFRPGDFVYRSNDASHAMDGGKLSPKWEGPYEVTEALGDGAYRLRSTDGVVLPRT